MFRSELIYALFSKSENFELRSSIKVALLPGFVMSTCGTFGCKQAISIINVYCLNYGAVKRQRKRVFTCNFAQYPK